MELESWNLSCLSGKYFESLWEMLQNKIAELKHFISKSYYSIITIVFIFTLYNIK